MPDLPFGKKQGGKKPSLMAALTTRTVPDPLADVEYPGDLAGDSAVELAALGKALKAASAPPPDANAEGFRDRQRAEQDRFRLATDTEYWFAMCFKSREEKDAFLEAAGLTHLGDKYLDGAAVGKILGVGTETGARPQE